MSLSFVMVQCDYFGFGCAVLNWKLLYGSGLLISQLSCVFKFDLTDSNKSRLSVCGEGGDLCILHKRGAGQGAVAVYLE